MLAVAHFFDRSEAFMWPRGKSRMLWWGCKERLYVLLSELTFREQSKAKLRGNVRRGFVVIMGRKKSRGGPG